jgi:hypothetical protein
MATYFGDFKLLMQRAKDLARPVVVMLEADGFAFLQQQSNQNPNAYAAVAATGIPELAGLPNTVAGWGMAFLQLRKSTAATNVVLGVHISGWASGKDIAHYSVTDPLQPEVDKVHAFLAPLGLAANATGATYDFLVGDPLDRDADFYRLTQGQDRWWNAADNASTNTRSFNRYAEWLRLSRTPESGARGTCPRISRCIPEQPPAAPVVPAATARTSRKGSRATLSQEQATRMSCPSGRGR